MFSHFFLTASSSQQDSEFFWKWPKIKEKSNTKQLVQSFSWTCVLSFLPHSFVLPSHSKTKLLSNTFSAEFINFGIHQPEVGELFTLEHGGRNQYRNLIWIHSMRRNTFTSWPKRCTTATATVMLDCAIWRLWKLKTTKERQSTWLQFTRTWWKTESTVT